MTSAKIIKNITATISRIVNNQLVKVSRAVNKSTLGAGVGVAKAKTGRANKLNIVIMMTFFIVPSAGFGPATLAG